MLSYLAFGFFYILLLISLFALQMQLKLLLPCILIACKSTQGSSTELCLLRANDIFQSVISVIKRCINGKPNIDIDSNQLFYLHLFFIKELLSGTSEIDIDGISQWRTINQACLSASLSLNSDYIKRIHQLEDKQFNYRKLLQMKLLFSLEHVAAFAKLAFEIEQLVKKQEYNLILSAVLSHSHQCFQAPLHDSDIQASESQL